MSCKSYMRASKMTASLSGHSEPAQHALLWVMEAYHDAATGLGKAVCGQEGLTVHFEREGHPIPFDPESSYSCKRCLKVLDHLSDATAPNIDTAEIRRDALQRIAAKPCSAGRASDDLTCNCYHHIAIRALGGEWFPPLGGRWLSKSVMKHERDRLVAIAEIIEGIEQRCMAADGPVTPTTQEVTDEELRRIYKLAIGVS